MPLYVLALTDTDLGSWTTGTRRIHSEDYSGVHVIHERRNTVPPMSDEELRAQHALVMTIAERAPAVLPARFGSLLAKRELTAAIARHHAEIVAALDQVRDHVQMTIRVLGQRAPSTSGVASEEPISGTEYLRRARLAAAPLTTTAGERMLAAVKPMVSAERREPGAGRLLATVYHLVDVHQVERYMKAAGRPVPGVIVSGPWPPFAFSPRLW